MPTLYFGIGFHIPWTWVFVFVICVLAILTGVADHGLDWLVLPLGA